jgi:periplasmic protein CpxP/Spy
MKNSLLSAVLASVVCATVSYAQPAAPAAPPMEHHRMERGSMEHGHMRGNPEQMQERHLDQMAKAANATPEQKAKLMAIAKAAQADTKPLHDQLSANRERSTALFSAPTIDRAAVEQLRSEQFKLMEQISRRRSQARLDSAEVLSAEQRAKLAAMMKKHHEGMGRGGMSHGHPPSGPAAK